MALDTSRGDMHVITWNVGGLTPDAALRLLGDFRKERIHPFEEPFVALLQEVIVDDGKTVLEQGDLQMIAGKQAAEWRGTGIVHTADFQRSRNKLLKAGTCTTLQLGDLRFLALSGHLPHHATIPETADIINTWEQQYLWETKGVLGMDANETFRAREGSSILSETARGELLLDHLSTGDFKFPLQEMAKPTYFPYNTAMQPRRLDYVCTRHMLSDEGMVHEKRDLARSDHEPISVKLARPAPKLAPKSPKTWGTRKLRRSDKIKETLQNFAMTCTDPVKLIADISIAITTPGRHLNVFRESPELRRLRRHILHMPPGDDRKMQWKALAKQRRSEHREWQTEQLTLAGKQWWQSKRAVDNEKHDNAWELRLRGDERWRETLQKHFGGIFHKGDIIAVARRMETIRHRITRRCKDLPWIPFSEEELKAVRKRWKNSKACGPDSISHESLKILEQDDRWRSLLLYVFNDMLYTAAIPSCIEKGITVLLAKTTVPGDWSDTRPIALSSTLLRSFSQLIIGRASHLLQGDSRLQWSRKSRQGVELILTLRRLCRVAHDWGLPMFLAKLDIRKAFDSIFQEAMAEQIEEDVSINGGMPWEARAWISLVHANEMEIVFREEHFKLPQSNGVRQGSPDSPIAFGRIVAKDLEKSLAEAKHAKPTSGEPPPEDGGCSTWTTATCGLLRQPICRPC